MSWVKVARPKTPAEGGEYMTPVCHEHQVYGTSCLQGQTTKTVYMLTTKWRTHETVWHRWEDK